MLFITTTSRTSVSMQQIVWLWFPYFTAKITFYDYRRIIIDVVNLGKVESLRSPNLLYLGNKFCLGLSFRHNLLFL